VGAECSISIFFSYILASFSTWTSYDKAEKLEVAANVEDNIIPQCCLHQDTDIGPQRSARCGILPNAEGAVPMWLGVMARARVRTDFAARAFRSDMYRLWESFRINTISEMDDGPFPVGSEKVAGNGPPSSADKLSRVALNTLVFPIMLVGTTTAALALVFRYTPLEFNSILYLIPVVISAMCWGVVPATIGAVASAAASDFFFRQPFYSFAISEPREVIDLALFLFVALVTGNLTGKLRREVDASRRRENEIRNLYRLSRRLALCSTASDLVEAIQEYLTSHLGCRAFLIRLPNESAESDMSIDDHFISTRVRAEAAEMIAERDSSSRLVFDPHLDNLWALKSITTKVIDHGVLAVNLGNHSPDETNQLNDRVETILSEAAVTLMRIDAVTAFANANHRLQLDFLKTAVIGSVSHELRSPIASILGSASVLDGMPSLQNDQRVRSLVDGMTREAKRLDNDIQNLLNAMRITDTGIKPVMEWTDPGDVVAAAIRQRSHRLGGHELTLDVSEQLPLLKLDSGLIEQAIGQVIENAAKYSRADTSISIRVKIDAEELIVAVTDEGIGLMPDEAPQIFKRAFRGHREIGTVPGLGLGLWIARIFIVANGGSIDARSLGPGRGTTVTVRFPVSAAETASSHAQIN
jgi:K+-sensing histidine kinase KdpD